MANDVMRLLKFRVTNFRSVKDSGWIDVDNTTALIGTNESGKTNLLLPLWKLNPASDGQISPTADFPRREYNVIRQMDRKPTFIEAHFQLPPSLINQLVELTGASGDAVYTALVWRDLAGHYYVTFPNAPETKRLGRAELEQVLATGKCNLEEAPSSGKGDEVIRASCIEAVDTALQKLATSLDELTSAEVTQACASISAGVLDGAPAKTKVAPVFQGVIASVAGIVERLNKPTPNQHKEARNLVVKSMPSFVYYSTYGNLDSEIYLPHVIENMERDDLKGRDEAKARTLKVLFDFVGLEPQEILDLGKEVDETRTRATSDQLADVSEKKKEREILLQSASSNLTLKFRDWWKQGEYRIRFQADGKHLRIWVSDDRRPEEIELEGRSTGLQWFLSFYLIFLVESGDAHKGAVLLLDEPGLSLHPLAQEDLSHFFANLSKTNQLVYTTHSPFLVDADHLDRVKAVYVDSGGHTVVSSDLRMGQEAAQTNSIYPVHAALGLSVSETLFQGCQPIVVEGQSDQIYLSMIKAFLVGRRVISLTRELLFIPARGARSIKAVVAIVSAKQEDLPFVLADGDSAGLELAKELRRELYSAKQDRVILLSDVLQLKNAEVEDLIPTTLYAQAVDRTFRGSSYFLDQVISGEPLVLQAEKWLKDEGVTPEVGWKVEVAKQVKLRFSKEGGSVNSVTAELWQKIFELIGSCEVVIT